MKKCSVGLDLRNLIFPGGYLQDVQDTQFRSNHHRILQGPMRKMPSSSSCSGGQRRRTGSAGRWGWSAPAALELGWGGEKGEEDERIPWRGLPTDGDGRKMAAGGELRWPVDLKVAAELWWTSGDGERWSTWDSTRGSSWWRRICSERTPSRRIGGENGRRRWTPVAWSGDAGAARVAAASGSARGTTLP
jgi:hypothetical protein